MKKILLLIGLVALCGTTRTLAQVETFNLTGAGLGLTGTSVSLDQQTIQGTDASLTFAKNGGSTNPQWYNNGDAVRMYGLNTLTINSTKTITKIEFTEAPGGQAITADNSTFDSGTFAADVWTGSASSVVLTNTVATKVQFRLTAITVTMVDEGGVNPPSISGTTQFVGSTDVTITAGEGASVYYTTDGTNPTTASTQYTTPFTITKTTTVKAIAVLNGKASAVVSKDFTAQNLTDETIESLNLLGNSPEQFVNLTLTNAKVVFVNGTDYYLREGDNAIVFFGTGLTLGLNDVLNGTVVVDYEPYNGLPEVKGITGLTNTDGLTITPGTSEELDPVIVTIDELNAQMHYADLIMLQNVQIIVGSDSKTYATDGTNQIQIYGSSTAITQQYTDLAGNGQSYDIVAIMNPYNTTMEIKPFTGPVTTGIESVTTDEQKGDGRIYNLAGQQVNKNTKGIVIKNGKKYIVK